MKNSPSKFVWLLLPLLALTGCSSGLGGMASDVGLAGAGGAIGYEVSGQKIGGAAIGAGAGYIASQIAQSQFAKEMKAAEKAGFDRAMNQAVKQQYWIVQNLQKPPFANEESAPRLMPVVIPESNRNGVVQNAHVEYLPIQP